MQFALCLCYWIAARIDRGLLLLYFLGVDAHIAPAVAHLRLAITPPDLREFVRGGIDARIIPGHWLLTPLCLPPDLRIQHRRFISIFWLRELSRAGLPAPAQQKLL